MAWTIRYGGTELDSDDMTIEELGEVERISDTPWSIANPLRSVVVAKGFIAVALLRAGNSQAEVANVLQSLTLRDIKDAFTYRSDDAEPAGEVEEPDPSLPHRDATTPESSLGEPGADGSPAMYAASA